MLALGGSIKTAFDHKALVCGEKLTSYLCTMIPTQTEPKDNSAIWKILLILDDSVSYTLGYNPMYVCLEMCSTEPSSRAIGIQTDNALLLPLQFKPDTLLDLLASRENNAGILIEVSANILNINF